MKEFLKAPFEFHSYIENSKKGRVCLEGKMVDWQCWHERGAWAHTGVLLLRILDNLVKSAF